MMRGMGEAIGCLREAHRWQAWKCAREAPTPLRAVKGARGDTSQKNVRSSSLARILKNQAGYIGSNIAREAGHPTGPALDLSRR